MGQEGVALFDALYAAHSRGLYAFLLGRTGDPMRAEDLLQETWVRAWRHLGDLRPLPDDRRSYWLYHVARNVLTDSYRRAAARPESVDLDRVEGVAAVNRASDEVLDLEGAIARLAPHLREVLAMSVAGGLTSGEIGVALGRPEGTVRYQLAEARRRLGVLLGVAERDELDVGAMP